MSIVRCEVDTILKKEYKFYQSKDENKFYEGFVKEKAARQAAFLFNGSFSIPAYHQVSFSAG